MPTNIKRIPIHTSDHWSIVSTQFSPSSTPKGVILFNGGTCILQNYYADFCCWLTAQNYLVYSYDYRGQGLSLGSDISDFQKKHAVLWDKVVEFLT